MPELFMEIVSVFPLASVNWDEVNCDRQSSFPDAPPETFEITANLILAMVPPVPVKTTSAASNAYWPALAPTVHVTLASALPLEL